MRAWISPLTQPRLQFPEVILFGANHYRQYLPRVGLPVVLG